MFIFAHVFAGALLGLVFWHLTNDRRAVLICIAGSIIPDVIDKSLGLLFPTVVSSGRTVFHSLGLVVIILLAIFIFVRSDHRLLGVSFVCALLLHQVTDEMWTLPANWFYPILGPFQGSMIPNYVLTYFWLEITNPAEWVFMVATLVILVQSYHRSIEFVLFPLSDSVKKSAYTGVIAVMAGTGLYLVGVGLTSPAGIFVVPFDNEINDLMTGLLALAGAVIMNRENYDTPKPGIALMPPEIQKK